MLGGKGTVALVGSGEFLPISQKLDRELVPELVVFLILMKFRAG
jgi:hypothetical protein